MAMDDTATIIPGRGTVFIAPLGTTPPNYKTVNPDVSTTFAGWDCVGHTSRDNTVSLSKDGGDVTTKGSWWSEALRTTRESVDWSLTFNSLQVDRFTMGLAFGGGVVEDGGYIVPDAVVSQERALFVLMVDGASRMGILLYRADMTLGDAPEIAVDDFFEIQIAATSLSSQGKRMKWFAKAFDVAA